MTKLPQKKLKEMAKWKITFMTNVKILNPENALMKEKNLIEIH